MSISITDLTQLAKPVDLMIPSLGTWSIDLHGGFQDWLSQGLADGRWSTGEELVRAILLEQGQVAGGPENTALSPDHISALEFQQIESAAAAILAVSRSVLRPKWIRREGTRRLRARMRRADEAYDMEARDGEADPDRLLRIAHDWREDRHLRDSELIAAASGSFDFVAAQEIERADEATRLVREAGIGSDAIRRAIETATGNLHGISALAAAESPALTAALRSIRQLDLPSVVVAQNALLGVRGALDLSRHLADAAGAISVGVEIARLTQINRPAYDAVSRLLAEQARSIHMALGFTQGLEMGTAHALSGLATPPTYFEDLRKQLRLEHPAAELASLAASQISVISLAETREALAHITALRPGFQMTAALGLSRAAPRGVVADILRFYAGEPDPSTPVFGAAMQTAHMADGDAVSDDQVAQLWATIRELQAQVDHEKDPVRRVGLFEIISLIGLLLGLLISGAGLFEDRQGRLADRLDREQQASFEQEMRLSEAEARAAAAERYRTTRFISSDGPLRSEPHARASVLKIVYAGQLAVANDQREGWVLVEVFGYAAEQVDHGWVPARRLRVGPN